MLAYLLQALHEDLHVEHTEETGSGGDGFGGGGEGREVGCTLGQSMNSLIHATLHGGKSGGSQRHIVTCIEEGGGGAPVMPAVHSMPMILRPRGLTPWTEGGSHHPFTQTDLKPGPSASLFSFLTTTLASFNVSFSMAWGI